MKEKMIPLTKTMIKQLQLARESELLGSENKIITPNHFKGTFSGLYKRGFVKTRKIFHEGKSVESVYITFDGVRYLEEYEKKEEKKDAVL